MSHRSSLPNACLSMLKGGGILAESVVRMLTEILEKQS
jgi:hypothetical protein